MKDGSEEREGHSGGIMHRFRSRKKEGRGTGVFIDAENRTWEDMQIGLYDAQSGIIEGKQCRCLKIRIGGQKLWCFGEENQEDSERKTLITTTDGQVCGVLSGPLYILGRVAFNGLKGLTERQLTDIHEHILVDDSVGICVYAEYVDLVHGAEIMG